MDESNLTLNDPAARMKAEPGHRAMTAMRYGRPRWKQWVSGAVIACAFAGLLSALWPREPSILARPVLMVDVRSWTLDANGGVGYYWLSDHELLFWRGSEKKGWNLFRYDLGTHIETPLIKVSKEFNRSFGFHPQHLQISPNGEWLLWRDSPATALPGRTPHLPVDRAASPA